MTNTVLLVIDMQIGNFTGSDPIYKGDQLLTKVHSLIIKARSAQVPIIFIQNCGGTDDPDEPGTPGFEIHPSIAPVKEDIVIRKQTPDSFYGTDLKRHLDSKKTNKLIITGLQTEYCVDTTCRRAFSLDYNVILVKNAHSTWNSLTLTAPQIIAHHNDVLSTFTTLKEESEIKF